MLNPRSQFFVELRERDIQVPMEVCSYDSLSQTTPVLSPDQVLETLLSQALDIMLTAPSADYSEEASHTLFSRALLSLRIGKAESALRDLGRLSEGGGCGECSARARAMMASSMR